MKDGWSPAHEGRTTNDEFQRGLEYFRKQDWRGAVSWFRQAEARADRQDPFRSRYTAYHGLALVLTGDLSGLNLCRNAARDELQDAEVFACQARAELQLNHRRRAWQAVRRGMQVDPEHEALGRLQREMGVRRPPLLPFLSRDHVLNRILGKLTYGGRSGTAKHDADGSGDR